MLYMLIGSFIFLWLEGSDDERSKRESYHVYKRERELLLRRMEEIISDRAAKRRTLRRRFINEAVDHFEDKVGFQLINTSQWNLMSAMYYSGTLFTTIGYGDISCVTTAGRIMTVIYSCVGIPLMLITLNDLGKFLYRNINGCVKNIETFGTYLGVMRICTRRHPKSDEMDMVERGDAAVVEASSIVSEAGSAHSINELELNEKPPRMSVKVALGITVGWIFFCSALFRLWEDWTYGESCYFMYISLSTIGLGDISVARRDMMVLCFVFVIVGLSLVSMSINVVQVALEDFYVNLMMKLIMEYQEKLAAGGDQMGASVGMMRMWGNNKTAKYLMPLLSKEKKRMAMDKVEKEAKTQGIEIPIILSDLDEKTGMPKLFKIEEVEEGKPPPIELEQMVQKQILQEEASEIPIYVAHDADCQTEKIECMEKSGQTEQNLKRDSRTQTEQQRKSNDQVETQTDDIVQKDVEAQTVTVDTVDSEMFTSCMPCVDTNCQTDKIQTKEQELQTYLTETIDTYTTMEMEVKNARIQTPCPVIEAKTIQTEDLEERKSPSKMSSARKRLRRAFAKPRARRFSIGDAPVMSEWKDVDDAEIQEEDMGSVESLHWDPVDGLHSEKQQPVSKLTALFDRNFDFNQRNRYQAGGRKFSSFKKDRESSRTRKSSE